MSKLYYQRLDDILEFLLKQNSPVSQKKIITLFEVTDRTIRNDVNTLNELLEDKSAKIVLIRGNGYQLEIQDADRFNSWWSDLNEQQAVVSTATNEDRQQALVFLLLTHPEPQTLDDLLDQLYVGKNTLYTYLKTARSWLSPFNLKIVNRPNIGFDLIGSEFNKRQAISELLIKKNLHDYLMDFTPVETALFNNVDLKKLQQTELSSLASLSLLDSDYFHKNILSALALTISRNKNGFKIENIPYVLPTLKEDILETVQAFFAELETEFSILLDKNERDFFVYTLALNFPRLVINEDNSAYLSELASKITHDLLHEIKQSSSYDWTADDTLRNDLVSHIEGLVNMDLFRNDRINPMLETIKSAFPLAFDLSLTHLEKIAPKYDFFLSEDEIGYIALHLAGAIERNEKESLQKLRVAIVCGSGKTMSKLIEMKISRKFANSVEVIGKYSYAEIQSTSLSNIDVIVTTISFKSTKPKIIFVDMNNLDRDLSKLQTAIDNSENNCRSGAIQLFNPDHFYYIKEPLTKEELLDDMVGNLVNDHYAPDIFLASILEREKLGQTNFNNILAIPHPMSLMALESVIPVAVIPDGIDWGDGHFVKFVFLSSITKEDYENTDYFYDLLLELMDQTEKQERILRNPTFDNFMDVIENLTNAL